MLAAVAARLGARAGVAIRLNPDVDPKTHTYISTGKKESKFGVDIERGEALARRVLELPSLELRGLQCHIGSQLTTVEPYVQALERCVALARALRADAPSLSLARHGRRLRHLLQGRRRAADRRVREGRRADPARHRAAASCSSPAA